MKLLSKYRLSKQLRQFLNRYQYKDDNTLNDGAIKEWTAILSNKDISLSDIDAHKYLWQPLFNLVARRYFGDNALNLIAIALHNGLPITQQVVLDVADKLDKYKYKSDLPSHSIFPDYETASTGYYVNEKGLKKFLELLTAFDAPWATTPYQYDGQAITVAQYLAIKTIKDNKGQQSPNQVFQDFFKSYANPDDVTALTADTILEKRREAQFANAPDTITIITDDGQRTDIQPDNQKSTKQYSTKMHF